MNFSLHENVLVCFFTMSSVESDEEVGGFGFIGPPVPSTSADQSSSTVPTTVTATIPKSIAPTRTTSTTPSTDAREALIAQMAVLAGGGDEDEEAEPTQKPYRSPPRRGGEEEDIVTEISRKLAAEARADGSEGGGKGVAKETRSAAELDMAGDSDEEGMEGEDDDPRKLPMSHQIDINFSNKPVSAMCFDPSGARLLLGGFDYNVAFYDFAGMDSSFKPFRSIRPCESHIISTLAYSPTGECILVCSGNCQPKLLNRDGSSLYECLKGDQYIVDQSKTEGHTAPVHCGAWYPKDKVNFITGAGDGTLRWWNTALGRGGNKRCTHVVKARTRERRKVNVTSCAFSRDGRFFGCGVDDGSLQFWEANKTHFVYPKLHNATAHKPNEAVSSIAFSYSDSNSVVSRSCDGTVKLWDLRAFKTPVHVKEDMPNIYGYTDVLFAPSDDLIVTGTSTKKGEGSGRLVFLDKTTFDVTHELQYPDVSVIKCSWHPKLNQIFVGLSSGHVQLYYDPERSARGAMLSVVKRAKRTTRHYFSQPRIITPFALKFYKDKEGKEMSTKKLLRMSRDDTKQSRKPQPPVEGAGACGRIGAAGGTLHRHMAKEYALQRQIPEEENPREALLKYAGEPKLWTGAWGDQHKTILADKVFEEDDIKLPEKTDEPVEAKKAKLE